MIKAHLGHETDNSNYRLCEETCNGFDGDRLPVGRSAVSKLISSVGCWSNDCLEADLGAACISKSEISKA